MLKSQKAISPILATLLIIVILVAAAIITYAWITTYITSTTESAGVWLVHEATSWNTASPYYMYYGSPSARSPPAFWSDSMGAGTPSKVYLAGDDFEEHAVGDTPDGWNTTLRGSTTSTWWNSSWTYRKKLTFDNSGQSENLVNFPVLVALTSSNFNFNKAKDNGGDIRFVDGDDSTVLRYEIEKWDKAGHKAWIWVKIPQIDGSSSTDFIYMYYGNTEASDGQDAASVWDNNFHMVHHLEETSGTHCDSTSNNNNSTIVNVTTQGSATGKIGGADEFVRTANNYITISDSSSLNLTTYTLELWFKADNASVATQSLLARGEDWTNDKAQWVIELHDAVNPNKVQLWYEEINDANHYFPTTTSISSGTWYYVTITRDQSSGRVIVYLQGNSEKDITDATTPWIGPTPLEIGCRRNDGVNPRRQDNFGGIIDEVRISNVSRSAAWIKAQHLSMTDAFITFASEDNRYTGRLCVVEDGGKVVHFNASTYVEPHIHGGSLSWTDYVYKIRMRRVEVADHQGIVFRFSDADNTVYAGVKENGTQIQCWKRINSTWIHLASYTIVNATDTWHTWEVRLKGQDFDLYWDGDLLGSLSLSPDELTSGKVGCFAGYGPTHTHYDNATVRKYVKPEPSTSLSAEEANHWWDLNYSYQKQISIHNNLASTLHSDYSVNVTIDTSSLVSAGKMLPDGNDLRIAYWNGTSWVQLNRHTMKMNTDSTQVWFKTQATFDANSSDNSKIAQMLVYVRNRGTEDAQIDKMYMGIYATNLMEVSEFSIAYNPETRMVNAGKTIRITVTYDWVAGRRYYFKVATRAGQLLEFNLKAPVTQ